MLPVKIALRYLFARKSHRAVNVISVIAMAAVAVAAMAIMVVLSVFNGFTDLAHAHLAKIDPDISITPVKGKAFSVDSVISLVCNDKDVAAAQPVITERALLVADGGRQMPVKIKAYDYEAVTAVADIDDVIIDGVFQPDNAMPDSAAAMQVSVGVALSLGVRPSPYVAADLYVPVRNARINPANPAAAFRAIPFAVTGVFQVDQPEYDNDYIFIPVERMRELLDYPAAMASAVEIRLVDGADAAAVSRRLQSMLPQFKVLGRVEQQSDTFRMIAVEKWVTFLMLAFILLIASFNIISSLSLLVIEKRPDMAILHALGLSHAGAKNIFAAEGWFITVCGGIVGIVAGIILVLIQQYFGIISLGGNPANLTIDTYPVRLLLSDVAALVVAVTVIGALIGAASRLFTRNITALCNA